MVPCKNCLLLPVCKNKTGSIKCELLYNWYWGKPNPFSVYTNKIRIIEKHLGEKTLISMLPIPEDRK